MKTPKLRVVLGQPSWSFRSTGAEACLTRLGGHLGPVRFRLGRRTIEPLSVAPWAEEKLPRGTPAIIRALRGDFFCAPFGENARRWRGEKHPLHGESANANWTVRSLERSSGRLTLHAALATRARRGRIDKFVTLIDGHAAVYQRHVMSARGPMDLGHHAMVKFPDRPGSGLVSTSRFVRGQVFPGLFSDPKAGSRQSLRPGARFSSLRRVPKLGGGSADLSVYPARRGYEDLVMVTADPTLRFAWTAVTFPRERYVWFALRDPQVLRHTLMWISNGGRDFPPWNGRHTGVMGLEEITANFARGLAESAGANPISRQGFPTVLMLDPKKPLVVNYIMAVAAIPPGFDAVADIRRRGEGVELLAASGKSAFCLLALDFLDTGRGI